MPQVNILFATPLFRGKFQGMAGLTTQLRDFILSLEQENSRNKNSPQPMLESVFESEFNLFNSQDPAIRKLKAAIYNELGAFIKQTSNLTDQELATFRFKNESWFHITREGGYFQPHTHPNASWSIVFCVTPGDDSPPEKAAGHIVFGDPRLCASSYTDIANANMRREYSFNAVRFKLQTGELIIFPSYLQHWVEPYYGIEPRITIAANFWFHQ